MFKNKNFYLIFGILFIINYPSTGFKQSNNKRVISDNNEIKQMINGNTNNKIINICPNEYKMCKCGFESMNSNIFSINCHTETHHHHQQQQQDSTTKKPIAKLGILLKINSTNYPHANLINKLDLSRTLIQEIPSDAFQVFETKFKFINLKFLVFFFFCNLKGNDRLAYFINYKLSKFS